MVWSRKHVCDLAGLCQKLEQEPALTIEQREKFAEIYSFAKQFSSIPNAGGMKNVVAVVSMVCGACQVAFDHKCSGRYDWQQPCLLMKASAC